MSERMQQMLRQRDKAWEYFQSHPDSYGAMADWEMHDDALREALDLAHDVAVAGVKIINEAKSQGPSFVVSKPLFDGFAGLVAKLAILAANAAPLGAGDTPAARAVEE